jgi:hypothetical protein
MLQKICDFRMIISIFPLFLPVIQQGHNTTGK